MSARNNNLSEAENGTGNCGIETTIITNDWTVIFL